MTKSLSFTLYFLCLLNIAYAQSFDNFQQLGGSGGEEGLHIQTTSTYSLLGGTFQETANIFNSTLSSKGNSDAWISLLNNNKTPIWTAHIASSQNVQFIDLQLDSLHNYIYALGQFSDSLWLGATQLYSSSRQAFLLKYSIQGQLLWVKTFGSAYFAQLTALHLSPSKIHLTGSYQDSFQVDTVLFNYSATKNAFVLTLDKNGNACWGYSFPNTFEAVGIALSASHTGELYWTGNFKGILETTKDSFLSNVVYPDIFLGSLDTIGQLQWLKTFKGVYADEVSALHYQDQQLYIAGQFMGLLQLGQQQLATAYRYYDLFLARLDSLGNPVWAVQSNSHKQHTWLKKMAIQNHNIGLVGAFEGYWKVDSQQVSTKGKVDGFYSQFSSTGQLLRIETFGGKGNDICQGISLNNAQAWLIGNFQDSLNTTYRAKGSSDAFVLTIPLKSWKTKTIASQLIEATLLTTPNSDRLEIVLENKRQLNWKLYNSKGELVLKGKESYIYLQSLSHGIYSLQLNNEEGFTVLKVVKK